MPDTGHSPDPSNVRPGKADLHLHTHFSDGEPSVAELLDYVAQKTDLSVIAVTDHDATIGAAVALELAEHHAYPFEVVVGEEVTTREGHIVGLFLTHTVEPGLSALETVEEIHAQGGLAFAPHPFFTFLKDCVGSKQRKMDGTGRRLARLPLDAVELDNGTPGLGLANLIARRFNAKARLPALGCSDAHIAHAVGKSYTLFPGHTAAELRQAIVEGATTPVTTRYSLPELFSYLRYVYLRYRRPRWDDDHLPAKDEARVGQRLESDLSRPPPVPGAASYRSITPTVQPQPTRRQEGTL